MHTIRLNLPRIFANRSLCIKFIFTPFKPAFSFASITAASETSAAVTVTRFLAHPFAIAIARQPLPVHMSSTLSPSSAVFIAISASCSVSGRGMSTLSSTFILQSQNSTSPIIYHSGLPESLSSTMAAIFLLSAGVTMRSAPSSLRFMPSTIEYIHSASLSSIAFSANFFFVSASFCESMPLVINSVSGISGSASISSTLLKAAIATSAILSSGSRVVNTFWIKKPGALKMSMNLLSNFATNLRTSYETPAITGRSTTSIPSFAKNSSTPFSMRCTPIAQLTSEIMSILMMRTMNKKEVPQRACRREHFMTFSTVRGIPFS